MDGAPVTDKILTEIFGFLPIAGKSNPKAMLCQVLFEEKSLGDIDTSLYVEALVPLAPVPRQPILIFAMAAVLVLLDTFILATSVIAPDLKLPRSID